MNPEAIGQPRDGRSRIYHLDMISIGHDDQYHDDPLMEMGTHLQKSENGKILSV